MMPAFWCYGQIYRQNLEVVMPAGKEGVFDHFMNLDIPIPGLKDYVNMMRWRRTLFRTRPAIFYSQANKIMHFNQLSHLDDSKILYILNYIKDSEGSLSNLC